MDLTIRQLEIFSSVARARSFTHAATDLLLSQPVVSRTVGELERTLRTPLLVRTTRSVELTDAGEEFLAVATGILDAYRQGLDRFTDYQAGERKQVTVAVLPSIAAVMLPRVLSGFLADHPAVQVRLADGTNDQVLSLLRERGADFAITEVGPASAGFAIRLLIDDPFVAVLPPGHALTAREELTWQDFADESFIVFSPDSSIRRLADLGLAQADVQPRQQLETRTVATAGGMIAAGLGVSAMPAQVLPLLSATPVVTRPLTGPSITRRIAVHQRADERCPATVQRLIDRIVQAADSEPQP
jgi:LysR family carnitine catabolism transcriptional activator